MFAERLQEKRSGFEGLFEGGIDDCAATVKNVYDHYYY